MAGLLNGADFPLYVGEFNNCYAVHYKNDQSKSYINVACFSTLFREYDSKNIEAITYFFSESRTCDEYVNNLASIYKYLGYSFELVRRVEKPFEYVKRTQFSTTMDTLYEGLWGYFTIKLIHNTNLEIRAISTLSRHCWEDGYRTILHEYSIFKKKSRVNPIKAFCLVRAQPHFLGGHCFGYAYRGINNKKEYHQIVSDTHGGNLNDDIRKSIPTNYDYTTCKNINFK